MSWRVKDSLVGGALGGGYIWGSAAITSAGPYMSFALLVVGVYFVTVAVKDLLEPRSVGDPYDEP